MKDIHVKRLLCYQGCAFSGLELHAKPQLVRYDPKCASQLLSDTPFYAYLQLINYRAYTSILLTKQLLCYSRHSFSTLELHASSNWLSKHTSQLISGMTLIHNLQTTRDKKIFVQINLMLGRTTKEQGKDEKHPRATLLWNMAKKTRKSTLHRLP